MEETTQLRLYSNGFKVVSKHKIVSEKCSILTEDNKYFVTHNYMTWISKDTNDDMLLDYLIYNKLIKNRYKKIK